MAARGVSGARELSACFDAVAAGASAEQLRSVIEWYAQGDGVSRADERRKEAVNYGNGAPLRLAHERACGDLVAVLLEAGADVALSFGKRCSPLALAIHYGLVDTLRWLLRSGRHDANEKLRYNTFSSITGHVLLHDVWCRPAHLAILPPLAFYSARGPPPPQPGALDVLVREFGADINMRDYYEKTPLHWLAHRHDAARHSELATAFAALGGDLDAQDEDGDTALYEAVHSSPDMVPILLSHGASPDIYGCVGTPLKAAIREAQSDRGTAPGNVMLLLRVSSRETRCATFGAPGDAWSAADTLIHGDRPHHAPWSRPVIEQLLLSGCPVHPEHVPRALAHASRLAARLEPLAAARSRAFPPWRRHETMIRLAFDLEEQRAVDAGVRRREARVAELERQLREMGGGGSGSGDESEGGGDEEGESGEG